MATKIAGSLKLCEDISPHSASYTPHPLVCRASSLYNTTKRAMGLSSGIFPEQNSVGMDLLCAMVWSQDPWAAFKFGDSLNKIGRNDTGVAVGEVRFHPNHVPWKSIFEFVHTDAKGGQLVVWVHVPHIIGPITGSMWCTFRASYGGHEDDPFIRFEIKSTSSAGSLYLHRWRRGRCSLSLRGGDVSVFPPWSRLNSLFLKITK